MSETTLYVECNDCHTDEYVTVNNDDLVRYDKGELVQNVWPSLTPEQREIIIGARVNNTAGIQHHLCGRCWTQLFSTDDE